MPDVDTRALFEDMLTHDADIKLAARCSCGYVFDHLEFKYEPNGYYDGYFIPECCPQCQKHIGHVRIPDLKQLKKKKSDMCFGYEDST